MWQRVAKPGYEMNEVMSQHRYQRIERNWGSFMQREGDKRREGV
jgi:hypothetical protein